MEKLPSNLYEILYGVAVTVILIGLAVYVFFWPEKKCPKCQTPLVRFMPPGSNYFHVGCPSCHTYTKEE